MRASRHCRSRAKRQANGEGIELQSDEVAGDDGEDDGVVRANCSTNSLHEETLHVMPILLHLLHPTWDAPSSSRLGRRTAAHYTISMRWTAFEYAHLAKLNRFPHSITPRERWLKLLVIRLALLSVLFLAGDWATMGLGTLLG